LETRCFLPSDPWKRAADRFAKKIGNEDEQFLKAMKWAPWSFLVKEHRGGSEGIPEERFK
jgi:hypothetical protein